jgi:CheY-like chemotaxis protein
MNGLELCTALKADPITCHIPAVLLTARGHVLTDEMLARTTIIKLMSKPFGVRDLLKFVQETLVPTGVSARPGNQHVKMSEAA